MQTIMPSLVSLLLQSVGLSQNEELLLRFTSPESLGRFMMAVIAMIVGYYYIMFKRRTSQKSILAEELQLAQANIQYLQAKLLTLDGSSNNYSSSSSSRDEQQQHSNTNYNHNKKEIRIFMDGAFDLMHYGHMNAFRLARSLGTHLVVGVNSDESITECKGEPLMKDHERLTMVQSCKFVDEVVPGCPYIMNKRYLDYVFEKYRIDYVIHGDDPCIVDGKDVYAAAKEAGKFRSIPRTEGVSTTELVGRMLLMTKEHHFHQSNTAATDNGHYPHRRSLTQEQQQLSTTSSSSSSSSNHPMLLGQQSKFLTTTYMLRLFSAGIKPPTADRKVVYMDGAWDLFHPGHVAILKTARERGDYLLVGIHGDAVVNRRRGMNLPLMNLHERVLSVLGCRYVDDVLIDAPYEITRDMIASLHIDEVVRGTNSDDIGLARGDDTRYRYPKEAGIFTIIQSPSNFNIESIIKRINRHQETFQAKYERKMAAEKEFYHEKYNAKT